MYEWPRLRGAETPYLKWKDGWFIVTPCRRFSNRQVAAPVVAVVVLLALSSLGLVTSVPSRLGEGGASPLGGRVGTAATVFQQAIATLERGSGPTVTMHAVCRVSEYLSARCETPRPQLPTPPASVPGFQVSTAGGTKPPGTYLGNLAWDVADQEAVFFGGWNGSAATNQTWVFHAGAWANETNPSDSPPARYGAAMAYDNETGVDAVVLFGGCAPRASCPMNDTWLFSQDVWTNLSPSIDSPPPLTNATMAGWGSNGTVLFGGCKDRSCAIESNSTWAFQDTSECQTTYHDPCWVLPRIVGGSPPGLGGVALADLPSGSLSGSVLLYGGFNRSCPACAERESNATWLLYGASWLNLTSDHAGSSYPNQSRSFASFFWDPLSGGLFLYGGVNLSTGTIYDQLWTTSVYTWTNESTWSLPSPAGQGPAVAGAPSGTGAPLRALLLGGEAATGTMNHAMWVFEPSLVNQINVVPDPVETNESAQFFSNTSGGALPTANWSTGDGGQIFGGNGSHTYGIPGTYIARLTVTDVYGVQNFSTVPVTVHLFSAGLIAPAVADQSLPAAFSALPTNGTAPYTYSWQFSDGTTASGAFVNHTFSSTGRATVTLNVSDATGTKVRQTASLLVNPPLKASVSVTRTVLDVDTTTNLTVQASNGTLPYRVVWMLPNTHTYVGFELSYRPTTSGAMAVSVSLADAVNATWSDVLALTVNPALSFTVSTTSNAASLGKSVSFSPTVIGGTPPYSYAWSFGDGATSAAKSPTHTYSKSGTFTVTAWVNDSGGGSFRQTVEVKIPKTSGGLLWVILALPTLDLLLLLGAIVAVVVVLAIAVHRWRKTPPTTAAPPPPARAATQKP